MTIHTHGNSVGIYSPEAGVSEPSLERFDSTTSNQLAMVVNSL